MLPFDGTACIVVGCGKIAPDVSDRIASCTHRLVVAVNRAARLHDIEPDVTLFIDADVYGEGVRGPCVFDKSVPGPKDGYALPMWRAPLPEWPNPGRLYQFPNTAAVAAVWALSVGCSLVGLVGCDCKDDGRADGQTRAMRKARDAVVSNYRDVMVISGIEDWLSWRYQAAGTKRVCGDVADRLREFYR